MRSHPRIWTRKRHAEKRGRAERRRQEIADQLRAIQSIPQFIKGLCRLTHAAGRASLTLRKMGANFARVGDNLRARARGPIFLSLSGKPQREIHAIVELADDNFPAPTGVKP